MALPLGVLLLDLDRLKDVHDLHGHLVQLEYLRRHGCDLIQGYYFSRPLGADAFVEFMCASRAQAGAATAGI